MTAATVSRRQLFRPDLWSASIGAGGGVGWQARAAAEMPAPDLTVLMLSRAGFGARPAEVEAARAMGAQACHEQQLDREAVEDDAEDACQADTQPT